MKDLQHECINALVGMKPHILAFKRAPNDKIAEKEWQMILLKMKRIKDALDAHYEKEKGGNG